MYIVSNAWMTINSECEEMWKESVLIYYRYYPDICLKGMRKSMKAIGQKVSVLAKIRTQHFRITNKKSCRVSKLDWC